MQSEFYYSLKRQRPRILTVPLVLVKTEEGDLIKVGAAC